MDESIKKALENLQAEANIDHWEGMEALLNDPANADLSESPEDHIIRDKLNDIQPEAAVGHWALMEAQLAGMDTVDAGELEDMMLDGKAYESLNDLNQPYNEAHWPIMEEKIETAFSWRRKAVRFKVAELAILLLAFITVLQYWPEAKEILPKIRKQLPKFSAPMASTPQASEINETAPINSPIAKISPSDLSGRSSVSVESGSEASEGAITNALHTDSEIIPNFTGDLANNQSVGSAIAKTKTPAKSNNIFVDNLENALNNEALTELPSTPIQVVDNDTERSIFEAIPTIPAKPIDELENKSFSLFTTALKSMKFGKPGLRIGMYGLSSYDAVDNNPEQIDLLKTSASTIGYGTGLSLAFKTGRWELESGIGYLSKTVKPSDRVVEVDQISLNLREFAGTSWTETQYDIINIPVHVRFDMMQRPKWKMYVQSGLSMSINQNVIYRYDQVYGGNSTTAFVANIPSEEEDYDRAKAFDPPAQVAKNVGANEGDLFSSNAYINMEFGFGLERAINRRYAAFLQTQYVHQFGPYNEFQLDEKNSIFRSPQLRAGIKATLFR